MMIFLFTFAIFALAIAGLAVGVMAGRKPIEGSCGGVACLKDIECATCPNRKILGQEL
ncbi:MAG: (Na+)-NQR maturation NqrM [Pseudomonadota bacterium]